MRTRILAIVCLLFVALMSAFAADASGKWAATIDTQIGALKWTYNFKVEGTTLTGTATFDGKDVALENGKVDGDAITFVENREFEGMGAMKIEYTGKIVSATEIKFKRQVGTLANEDFVAKRSE